MISLAIFDIDGVVADDVTRRQLPPNIYYTNTHLKTLAPRNNLIKMVKEFIANSVYVIFLTGRDEKTRKGTEAWLNQYVCSDYDELIMRPDGLGFDKIDLYKTQEVLKLAQIFKRIAVYEDSEENLMMIGRALPQVQLFLVKDDTVSPFDFWERPTGFKDK